MAEINSYAANVGYTEWAAGGEAWDMEDIVRGLFYNSGYEGFDPFYYVGRNKFLGEFVYSYTFN
jgi:hypothetical protein